MMELPFTKKWASHTKAVEREVIDLSKAMTLQDVSHYLDLDWRTVKEIQKNNLLKKYKRPPLKGVRNIGIDEICIGKGHRYTTVVVDLDSGRVIFMGDGKDGACLIPFWKRLKRAKANIEAVAIDMGPAYIAAVKEHQPQATIVFDHFHVVKLLNDKISAFRRDLYNRLASEEQRAALKGSRWLLLKNSENLDDDRDESKRLIEALRINEPLSTVYYMKEELRQLWRQQNKSQAEELLISWAKRAEASGIQMLKKFGYMLLARKNGILAYYDNRLSTGPVEGFNNKIKTIQRQAYGYRDQEFFRLKVYASHEAKFKLVG
jgi:transposase